MKLIAPKYTEKFKCKAGKCQDSCCIGWEIDIDRVTLSKYRNLTGELRARLDKNIVTESDGTSHFVLSSGERCPFLNTDGLCDIICALGDGALCDICREHPRYYTTVGDVTYGGIGMCCEAAAELILTEHGKHEYIQYDDFSADAEYCDEDVADAIIAKKKTIVDIFRDKTLSCGEKATLAIDEIYKLQSELDGEENIAFPDMDTTLAKSAVWETMAGLEYMGDELLPLMRSALDNIGDGRVLSDTCRGYLENILVYFTDRYFLSAAEDYDALSPLAVILTSALIIGALMCSEGEITLSRAVYLAHLYSKEIEYSEDNIAAIREMSRCGLLDAVRQLFGKL